MSKGPPNESPSVDFPPSPPANPAPPERAIHEDRRLMGCREFRAGRARSSLGGSLQLLPHLRPSVVILSPLRPAAPGLHGFVSSRVAPLRLRLVVELSAWHMIDAPLT